MKTNFDIDAYFRLSEEGFSNLGNDSYYGGVDGFIEEPEQPIFNRKRILLLCR